ncbi:DnaJ domain protein [Leptospira ryugenii]|uniref:DnaJ domain protein n=1 Tax=Leptospira ryugenii TaxID=1917863 RepID=A0A2P2E292_9LEPT|nr:J domain-containing protein [Leptospira ryugenii]GBF51008.1 DnaJ domain protein [Leptospira ryugenii]
MFGNTPKIPDYYEALELPFGATAEEIRSNFRRLAKIYHPDVKGTGSENQFKFLLTAYKTLSTELRKEYDEAFKKSKAIQFIQNELSKQKPFILPPSRIQLGNGILELARKGLMRKGFRNRDRKKITGINYDILIKIKKNESMRTIIAQIPLTVRIVCQTCMGGDPHCPGCDGAGSYKSSRNLTVEFPPSTIQNQRIYEFDLSKFRPDSYTHFKKKILRVKLHVTSKLSLAV